MSPIEVDVVPRVDESALRSSADQIDRHFAAGGGSAADVFGRAFTSGLGGSTAGLRDVARAASQEFSAGLRAGLGDAVSGVTTQFGALGRAGSSALSGVVGGAGLAAAGVAAIGVAAIEVGQRLYDVGARYDAMADAIAVRTGKTGEDLDALTTSVRNVYRDTASSLEQVGDVGARVSQSFNLTGGPLEELTKQISDLNRMTGEALNVRDFSQTLRGFDEDGAQASASLDTLYTAASKTGIPLQDLISTLGNIGPAARSLGLDMDATTGMIVAFEQAGIDADKTAAGLNRAAAVFADNGINMQTGLRDTITQIRGFIDAGNDAAAVDLAGKVFGTRSAQAFVDAIRQGVLNVDSLKGNLGDTGGAIENLNERTHDWAENWQIIKNRVDELTAKVGGPLFDALNGVLGAILQLTEPIRIEVDATGLPVDSDTPRDANPLPPSASDPTNLLIPGGPTAPAAPSAPTGSREPGWGGPPPTTPGQGNPLGDILATPHTPPPPPAPPQDIAGALADDDKGGSGAAEPKPSFDPSQYSLESLPLGAFPGEQGLGGPAPAIAPAMAPTGTDAQGPGYYEVDPQKVYDANTAVMSAQDRQEQDRVRLLELQADDNATAQDIQAAQRQLLLDGRNLQSAEMKLQEAQQGTWKKMQDSAESFSTGMDQIGASLDQDFGISDGLAGIAENLFKFLANLAAAPVIGALSGVQTGLGFSPGSAGAGLFGMGAGTGAFGPQYMLTPQGLVPTGSSGGYSPSALGPSALQPGYAADPNVNAMLSLAQQSSGNTAYAPASDLINGLADCSGSISDLYEVLTTGRTTPGRMFTTTNFASDAQAAQLGFYPGFMPGALNVGVNPYPGQSGHMAATLPNGVNFEGGGGTGGGAQYGGPAAGALDPQFEKHYYYPVGGRAAAPTLGPTAGPLPTGWGSPGIPSTITPGVGGQGPVFGAVPPGPGVGGAAGAGALPGVGGAAGAPPAAVGGRAAGGGPGGGGFAGLGGLPMAAINTGISAGGLAVDAMAPGAGQVAAAAAQTGIQLINRAIGFGGQAAGIAVGGVLQTLLPNNSPLADPANNWIGRIAGGIAGARPALPNMAGQAAPPQPGPDPKAQQQGKPGQPGAAAAPLVEIKEMHNYGPDGQGVASDIARVQMATAGAPAPGGR